MALPFVTDEGIGCRANLGLIVLQSDEVIENEFRRLIKIPGVAGHISRVPSDPQVTAETLARMEREIPNATALLPPSVAYDAVAYACTSGATIIGEDNVAAAVHSVLPGTPVTNPMTAIKAACAALGVARLGFVTPYVADVSAAMRAELEKTGIEIAGFGSFEQAEEKTVTRISPASIANSVRTVAADAPCDAVFVSCTNLRAAEIVTECEAEIGKPVLTSNLALIWHLLRLAGVDDAVPGGGELFG